MSFYFYSLKHCSQLLDYINSNYLFPNTQIVSSDIACEKNTQQKFAPRVREQNPYVTKEVKDIKLRCAKRCLALLELTLLEDPGNSHFDSIVLTVSELSTSQHRLSVLDIATLSRQLTAIVYACHRYDFSHGYISDSTVQIGLTKNYQTGSGIIIHLKPKLCTDRTDKEQDIYNMGCVVRKLMQLTE